MKKIIIACVSFFGLMYYAHTSAMELSLQKVEIEKAQAYELFSVVNHNKDDLLRQMIQEKPYLVHAYGRHGDYGSRLSALHMAAYRGCHSCMKVLLEHGADPNGTTKYKSTPLHHARTVKGVELLLMAGGRVDARDNGGYTPFYNLIENGGSLDVAQALLNKNADINDCENSNQLTPLHRTIELGMRDSVDFLLQNNADIYKKNKEGKTSVDIFIETSKDNASMIAVFEKHGIVFFPGLKAQQLFQNPFEGDAKIFNYWAHLVAAARRTIKRDKKQQVGASGILINKHGCIAQHISVEDLEFFLDKGITAKIDNVCHDIWFSALTLIEKDDPQALAQLLGRYPFFVTTYSENFVIGLLKRSIECKDVSCLRILLNNGIDYLLKPDNSSMLRYAVDYNNVQAIELLMRAGANCLKRDFYGITPLVRAKLEGKDDCAAKLNELIGEMFVSHLHRGCHTECKQLLQQIIYPNLLLKDGDTLVHHVITYGSYKYKTYIRLLKEKGANFNMPNKRGAEPLWGLMHKDDFNIYRLEVLLVAGARLDIENQPGISPLHIVAYGNRLALVKLFLRYGARVQELDMLTDEWEGSALLREAYNKQQQAKIAQIEAENKALASTCFVCFEDLLGIQTTYCKNTHEGNFMCNNCCQELKNRKDGCPVCRGQLL